MSSMDDAELCLFFTDNLQERKLHSLFFFFFHNLIFKKKEKERKKERRKRKRKSICSIDCDFAINIKKLKRKKMLKK